MKTYTLLCLVAVQLINASYNVLLKQSVVGDGEKPPNKFVFTFARELLALIILLVVTLFNQDGLSAMNWKKHWQRYFNLGLLGLAGNHLFFIFGLQYLSATNASILTQLQPIFALTIGIVSGVENVTFVRCFGVAVALIGAVCVIYYGEDDADVDDGKEKYIGVLCIVCSSFSFACYHFMQKPLLQGVNALKPLIATLIVHITGSLIVGVITLAVVPPMELATQWQLSQKSLYTVAFAALFTSVVKYALQASINRNTPVSILTMFNSLNPLLTAILSIFTFGESLGAHHLFGVLVVCGIVIVLREGQQGINGDDGGKSDLEAMKERQKNKKSTKENAQ